MTDITNHTLRHGLPVDALQAAATPLYLYDMGVLRDTLREINRHTGHWPATVHYAVKANTNLSILAEVARQGLGADLVSGGELRRAEQAGFSPEDMTYAGVGKTDDEIKQALQLGIGCFNVESEPELEVINALAGQMGVTARVALRVNPDIDAHTHRYITTGTAESKFGIALERLPQVVDQARGMANIALRGLHFHIGSQITQMRPFEMLCATANDLLADFEARGVSFDVVNVGGGLGIDYERPEAMPPLGDYFGTFKRLLRLRPGQTVHFELGRAVVGQCGSLIARVTYVKQSRGRQFVILDAGMNDLMRPALYQAHHLVQNLTSVSTEMAAYDVVGPVCESSDVFARDCRLPVTVRGDLLAIRSAGAYGESMASTYNSRPLPATLLVNR